MGFQGVQIYYHAKPAAVPVIAPYYGLSTLEVATEAMILNLAYRGPTAGVVDATIHLNASVGSGMYQFYAYPAAYGPAKFYDIDSGFYGGWDGANNDFMNIWGPLTIDVTVAGNKVPFFVYRTDYPDLGSCNWTVSSDA